MPPRKKSAENKKTAEKKKPSAPKASIASLYERRLEESNELEPLIRSIVARLMFASGDSEEPLTENEDFVVNMLKNELILFFNDVFAVHDNKIERAHLEHILPLLKTQKGIISRFVKYLENRVEITGYMRKKGYCENGTVENICGQDIELDGKNEEDGIDEIGEVGGAEGEYLKKKRRKIGAATIEEALLRDVQSKFASVGMRIEDYQEFVDETQKTMQSALQIVIQDMSSDDYGAFAAARRISFQAHSTVPPVKPDLRPSSRKRKREVMIPTNCRQALITWIGNPPISGEPALVFVAFLAKEIVSELVGSALIERKTTNPSDSGPLIKRYYEETLRKNKKFRKYGRLLI